MAGGLALAGEVAHLAAVVAALAEWGGGVLAVLAPLVVVLELDLDLLAADGGLVVAGWGGAYLLTHSWAVAWSLSSAKAKQYSELRLRLATMLSTCPHFSNILRSSSSSSLISIWVGGDVPCRRGW